MTRVICDLNLRYIDGRNWLITSPFSCESEEAGVITVEAGETTDFNSIPVPLWNILPPDDYGEAAALHDHLYRTGLLRGQPVDRGTADRVHREFVKFRKAPGWKVVAMYAGLRAFGWKTWNAYRAKDAARAAAGQATP